MTISSKKAENISLVSLFLSVLFFIIAFFLGKWSGYLVVEEIGWYSLAAALIWLVLWVHFRHRQLAEQERLDLSQIEKDKDKTTLFEAHGGHKDLFAVAQNRLAVLEKWFIPIFSVIIAIYQIGMGVYLFRLGTKELIGKTQQPLVCAVAMVGLAFVSFLISRYAAGMSLQMEWKPLRSGASFLLGGALLSFVLAIGLALAQFNIDIVLRVMRYVIPVAMVVLGAENALNAIFDIYRPRIKGHYDRSAFDSRLLGIINEPGGILYTAASAIDYQFGFNVSQTWFYKLLEKAVVPLVLFSAAILYAMSCLVIVAPNEQAIIEHFGNPKDAAGNIRLAGPGLTWKLPWPIDVAYKYQTGKIMQLFVGYVPKEYKAGENREALLWGKSHYQQEYKLLVASEQSSGSSVAGAVPVSLVVAAVPVQYRIKDLYAYIYTHKDAEKALEDICYKELTEFGASAKIEVDQEYDIENSLLGAGRTKAKSLLTERIQKAADDANLGIEVVFLGFEGLHPPPEVALDYQKVVGSTQQKQAKILDALAERNQTLSELAGSTDEADKIYALAVKYQQSKDTNSVEEIDKLGKELDDAFYSAKGNIFDILRKSQTYAFEKSTTAKATGLRFADQIKAYMAQPEIFKKEQRLAALEESLKTTRKYIVVADKDDTQVFIIDVEEKLTPSLFEMEGLEENKQK